MTRKSVGPGPAPPPPPRIFGYDLGHESVMVVVVVFWSATPPRYPTIRPATSMTATMTAKRPCRMAQDKSIAGMVLVLRTVLIQGVLVCVWMTRQAADRDSSHTASVGSRPGVHPSGRKFLWVLFLSVLASKSMLGCTPPRTRCANLTVCSGPW